jgi:hypothetical protein
VSLTIRVAGVRALLVALAVAMALPAAAQAPPPAPPLIKATVPASTPAWSKGIQPLNRDSYYHAIECGKNGAAQPSCVFYDAGLCKNDDFVLALYSPYKQVAYEVWSAVSRKRPAPTPSYQAAQQTRVVIGVTPVRGAKNQIATVVVKRGGKTIEPDTRTIDGTSGNFIFGFPPFAPTATITLEMVGKARTISCVLDRAALSRLR